MPPRSFERILVFRFGRIGDLLVLTPALRALRQAFPAATIELVTTPIGAATLSTNPNLDAIHALRWRRLPWQLNPEKALLLRQLRRRAFDVVFQLEVARRYEVLARRLDVPKVYGFTQPGEPESPLRVAVPGDAHGAELSLRVLALADVPDAGRHYDFPLTSEARHGAETLLAKCSIREAETLVGVHAGQFRRLRRWRRTPHSKTWPPQRFAQVIGELAERGADRFVLTGAADERRLADSIIGRLPPGLAVNLAGRTDLQTLGTVIERCSLFISLDTGPAHIAAAVGTPLVVLFGPTAPAHMGPQGDESRIKRIYLEPSDLPPDARGGYHPRMWAIQVADVVQAVEALSVGFTH